MSRTVTVSDPLYTWLEAAAHSRGLSSIEQLLEQWRSRDQELQQRRRTVQQIEALRERLRATYGEMPDSTELVREDRMR